jgi:hypothetical protein
MNKLISAIMMSGFVVIGSMLTASSVDAQTRYYDNYGRQVSHAKRNNHGQRKKAARMNARYNDGRYYDSRTANSGYYSNGTYYGGYKQPNVYDRHRKAVNLSVGTATGAAIGAAIGGGKGALIGAGVGLATGAVVTKKQRPRNYPKPVRRY